MSRKVLWGAVVGACVVVAVLVATEVAGRGPTSPREPAAARRPIEAVVPAAERLTVVHGVVVSHGQPAKGEPVLATAWAEEAVLSRLRRGERMPMATIGRTRTDRNGGFSLELDSRDLHPRFVSPDGWVDVELSAGSLRPVHWTFTAMPAGRSSAAAYWGTSARPNAAMKLRMDLGTGDVTELR